MNGLLDVVLAFYQKHQWLSQQPSFIKSLGTAGFNPCINILFFFILLKFMSSTALNDETSLKLTDLDGCFYIEALVVYTVRLFGLSGSPLVRPWQPEGRMISQRRGQGCFTPRSVFHDVFPFAFTQSFCLSRNGMTDPINVGLTTIALVNNSHSIEQPVGDIDDTIGPA